jgi:hypothetical protein
MIARRRLGGREESRRPLVTMSTWCSPLPAGIGPTGVGTPDGITAFKAGTFYLFVIDSGATSVGNTGDDYTYNK